MSISTLSKFTVPLANDQSAQSQGLLMPKLQYRFRVVLENFGVLATSLIENPIRINFSHVLAAAIVFAQLLTGAGYYIFYNNQKKSKEYIWPLLKVLMMFSLICIAFIEIIIWANLSASFDMTKVIYL